jgi:hypothetical protein
MPDRTFKEKETLLTGNDAIDLYYYGPAHTNGDALVVFRNLRVMHAGDMFAQKGLPNIDAANGGRGLAYGEALGQCFLDRGSPELALSTLDRALHDGSDVGETSLVGVVYLLGEAHERLGQRDAARVCFERVVSTDIEFRDAARRLTQLSASTP